MKNHYSDKSRKNIIVKKKKWYEYLTFENFVTWWIVAVAIMLFVLAFLILFGIIKIPFSYEYTVKYNSN